MNAAQRAGIWIDIYKAALLSPAMTKNDKDYVDAKNDMHKQAEECADLAVERVEAIMKGEATK